MTRLKIIEAPPPRSKKWNKKEEHENLWKENPKQFDPYFNAMDKIRIQRTIKLIEPVHGFKVIDVGCGSGAFFKHLSNFNVELLGIDIARAALDYLSSTSKEKFSLLEDSLPQTSLPDGHFDMLLCCDVIAELNPREYRLVVSEWARLLKRQGLLICSTPIDYKTEKAPNSFINLVSTEFEIERIVVSYHAILMRIRRFVSKRKMFILQKSLILVDRVLQRSVLVVRFLEIVTRVLFGHRGISHVIVLGKRKEMI